MSSEVALSLAVLLAAVLLVKSFVLTLHSKPGFEPGGVMVMHAPLADGEWRKSYELYQNRIAPELLRLPGVREVAAVNAVPMSLGTTEHIRFATRFGIEGMSFDPGQYPTAQLRWCTPAYFHVLGIPLVSGRLLSEEDHGKERYVINQALASRFFPRINPVGKKLWMNVVTPHPEAAEIVGVVGDVREFGLSSDPEPAMYQVDVSNEMDIVIKTAEATAVPALEGSIAATMRRVNPAQAISQVTPLDRNVGASLARQRFLLWLIAALAAMAVLLCIVGLYGVFSYSVTRRMREFGIRSAVGAQRRHLLNQVIAEGALVILPGLAAGLGLAAGCSKLIATLLYRVSPTDSVSMALAASGILVAGLGSVVIPALRAMRADPAIVLRAH